MNEGGKTSHLNGWKFFFLRFCLISTTDGDGMANGREEILKLVNSIELRWDEIWQQHEKYLQKCAWMWKTSPFLSQTDWISNYLLSSLYEEFFATSTLSLSVRFHSNQLTQPTAAFPVISTFLKKKVRRWKTSSHFHFSTPLNQGLLSPLPLFVRVFLRRVFHFWAQ